LAFLGPGLFNALSGLGGAGNENTDYANAANATLYATFAFFGYMGGMAFNLLGNRVLMCVGGFTYAIYAATQYIAGNVSSAGWVSPLGGAILGFGAGWFWTAQGAMMLAYSVAQNRGKFIAIFWVIFNLGATIGGFITFGVNYNATSGTADPTTYFIFIALMCLGAILSVLLLTSPTRVKRADGETVYFEKAATFMEEIRGVIAVTLDSNMLLLSFIFFVSNFAYTYTFNGINNLYYNIRSRGLNSALYWASQMFGSVVISYVLDVAKWTTRKRGIWGWVLVFVEFNVAFAMACYLVYGFEGGVDKDNKIANPIDFKESSRSWYPTCTMIMFAIGDAFLQTYAYWLMGSLAKDDTKLCARYTGFYKGVQSAGAAVAWGIDLQASITYEIQMWINWVLYVVSMLLAFVCVWRLSNELSVMKSLGMSKQSVSGVSSDAVGVNALGDLDNYHTEAVAEHIDGDHVHVIDHRH